MFGGSNKQQGFVRTKISPTERVISYTVLAFITAIGFAIAVKGRHFDPDLFALDPAYLENTQPAWQEVKLYGENTLAAASTESSILTNITPQNWSQLGATESFTAGTLYEKINGRAEQYLTYNVVGMDFVGFTDQSDFIDVFVYDMGTPLNAFGIYSVERTEGQPSANLGRESYVVEASTFFWKGKYYIQIVASTTNAQIKQAASTIAQTLDSRVQDNNEPLWGFTSLPAQDRIEDTVQYFKRDALSLDFLGETFTARYKKGDEEITAFISQQNDSESAASTLTQYKNYLTDYGQILSPEKQDDASITVGDMGGIYDIVFQHNEWVGGITMATDQKMAAQMVSQWLATFSSGDDTEEY